MAEEAEVENTGPSAMALVIALVVSTVVAVGGGGGLGLVLFDQVKASINVEAKSVKKVSKTENQIAHLKTLPPILTNLANSQKSWIRLETSLVLGDEPVENIDILVGHITTDIIAFLRTLNLSQIEGSSGFQHLKEDLNERALLRSKGQIKELVIHSMIVE